MKALQVVKPGLFMTVQDLGRYGFLRYGVPISGAMDTFSLVAANLLVGNEQNDACLETTFIGPELQALVPMQIAITGGSCSPKINDQSIPMWQTVNVQEGDFISFGSMESGCRAYIALRGGIDVPLVLGSRSTYVRGTFGGAAGRHLKIGDVIESFKLSLIETQYALPDELIPQFTNNIVVHVILGPQDNMFTDEGIETFLSNSYKVTLESDRMGYRLNGPVVEHKGKVDIVSDALLPGAVQVPKDGKPIVIMRDAQTTGGYPKIAVVVSSDLCLLGQAKPNDAVEFSRVTIRQAQKKGNEYSKMLSSLDQKLKAAC